MAKKPAQTMDLTQATQMLQWLEEERRKDKATIAALEERAKEQEQQLADQTAAIREIKASLAGAQSLIARAAEFEQMASNYKNEVSFMLDQREDAWRKEQAEAEKLHKVEIEGLVHQLDEIDLPRVRRHDQELKLRQAEDQRLNEAIQRLEASMADLNKRSDDRVQAVTYLEEQRRSDNRRIAELEQDTTELRKKIEAQASEMLILKDTIAKHKAHIDKAVQQVKDGQKFIDEVRAGEFRREQKFKKFSDQMDQLGQEMEEWQTQHQRFVEQYQLNKRALEKLEGFQDRVEKRQNEVAEMQRLAEDRLKRQWEEWQAAIDKELRKRELMAEEQGRIQEDKHQKHVGALERLEDRADVHQAHIEMLLEDRRQEIAHALEIGKDAISRIDQLIAEGRSLVRHRRK